MELPSKFCCKFRDILIRASTFISCCLGQFHPFLRVPSYLIPSFTFHDFPYTPFYLLFSDDPLLICLHSNPYLPNIGNGVESVDKDPISILEIRKLTDHLVQ
uniref:Uncharacterized protein n=1 Tax=Salix viminalis TaxID=40686 RepID=A0A6N2LIV1_SALVM